MDRVTQLNEIYAFLRGKGYIHTKLEFAKSLGLDKSSMYMAFSGQKKFLSDNLFINRIPSAFPNVFNREWLLNGCGVMLNEPLVPLGNVMSNISGMGIQNTGNGQVNVGQSTNELEFKILELNKQILLLKEDNIRLWNAIAELKMK